jgi:alpha,alpha-trehalose phosphorylase
VKPDSAGSGAGPGLVIGPAHLAPDPWKVHERELDLDRLAWSESVFALSNGHLGLRGNLEEGEPVATPGTYVNSVYEQRPLPYAEAGYGDPESGQTIINVTDGKVMRLLVDDEPFDVRYGDLHGHERILDLRAGCLHRSVHWTSPAGQQVLIRSTRLVSLTQRSVAAIRFEVEPLDGPARIVVQSELVVNEPQPPPRAGDPRVAAALRAPLVTEHHSHRGSTATFVHRVARSGIGVAAAMTHEWDAPGEVATDIDTTDDLGRFSVTTALDPGQTLTVTKYLAYGWSSVRSIPALRDQVDAALTAAVQTGWDGLVAEQRQTLDGFWELADVEIGGDAELQQAIRFAMFQVFQAGARAERRPIAAKGLTGNGYDGHSFWDTEAYVLPVLTFCDHDAAADALRWRQSTLPAARRRAASLGLSGAAFPWRTINGDECSGYWPAGTAAFHVNGAIAHAVVELADVIDDPAFEREVGVELLVETARLWRSLGHHDDTGAFRIDGVTGPDEYSAIADNNVYTNLLAQENLRVAARAAETHAERAAELGVDHDEIAGWRAAADSMVVPYDENRGIHPQSEGFLEHEMWDFAGTSPDEYPLLKSFPYFDLYRKQVAKQADLVLALQMFGEQFEPDQKRRDFEHYEAICVRDSSLSASTQAIVAAEVGHLDLALDYLAECALIDLVDHHRNAADGLHLACLAGAWNVVAAGFGGLCHQDGKLKLHPRLPDALDHLRFGFHYRRRRIVVTIRRTEATYQVLDGDPIELLHHGTAHTLGADGLVLPVPEPPQLPRPHQPPGRAPRRVPRSTLE